MAEEHKGAYGPNRQHSRRFAERLLRSLSDCEQQVPRKRFGIDPDGDLSPEDSESHYSATAKRIIAIEAKALRKLDDRRPPDDEESQGFPARWDFQPEAFAVRRRGEPVWPTTNVAYVAQTGLDSATDHRHFSGAGTGSETPDANLVPWEALQAQWDGSEGDDPGFVRQGPCLGRGQDRPRCLAMELERIAQAARTVANFCRLRETTWKFRDRKGTEPNGHESDERG